MGMFHKAFRLVAKSMAEGRDFDLVCAEEVTIATRSRHLTVACDGEKRRMRTPLRLRIHAEALEVFAPPEAAAETADGAGRAA
jgi:diacylglycerol kinase family enzyme